MPCVASLCREDEQLRWAGEEIADMSTPIPTCSFCGKGKHEVKSMVAGPNAFICDNCVERCVDIISEGRAPRLENQNEVKTTRPLPDDAS
jgi:ATP-dependent Clp protease ATP-binding subunit ClpX